MIKPALTSRRFLTGLVALINTLTGLAVAHFWPDQASSATAIVGMFDLVAGFLILNFTAQDTIIAVAATKAIKIDGKSDNSTPVQ
jgi:hypothetical protein